MFIDADAHVDECTETWSYFPKAMADLRPGELVFLDGEEPPYLTKKLKGPGKCLFVDGRVYQRRVRSDELTHTTVGARELQDVPGRLRQMDEYGVDAQIIFPSTLLQEITNRPELEVAICESYNRWLADRCGDSGGRLQWNAVLPLRSMPDALKEMRRVKEEGAVGIFKRSIEADNRVMGDDYFYPVYAEAQELDLPISVHVSSPYAGTTPFITKTESGVRGVFYSQDAFLSLLIRGVCTKFPTLRFSFVEAASTWLHYIMYTIREDTLSTNRVDQQQKNPEAHRDSLLHEHERVLEESRLYVACEAMEDLPAIIGCVGDNNLVAGTDYGHSDRSSVLNAHQRIVERTDISEKSAEKITETNARTLYGLF